jgi:hypothetical protein
MCIHLHQSKLSKAAAKRLWKEVKRVAVWNLPRTDYSQNLSDDCYHLGSSLGVMRTLCVRASRPGQHTHAHTHTHARTH